MKKKTAKTVPKAKPAPAPLNYEEPVLVPPASAVKYNITSPASVIAEVSALGSSGRVGPDLAGRIIIALEEHGYTIDEKVPF